MTAFNLFIQSDGTTCRLRLAWGDGRSIAATVTHPDMVFKSYGIWQTAYLNYYRSFRARVRVSGTLPLPKVDWRSKLIEAETELLESFQFWLNQASLLEIRVEITQALQQSITDLFITCDSPDFDRLPWEIWKQSREFSSIHSLRIARQPNTIRSQTTKPLKRSRLRVLVILGDETGLDFQAEKAALKDLSKYADVSFVGWQGKEDQTLRSRIRSAITDPVGWDFLFFAGHSNETALTGGELGIAPGESLALVEIVQDLKVGIDRGLQFAIFNSCRGLSIAQTLIDVGLSQVMIMREPIHNSVAQQFLITLLQQLILGCNIDSAMRSASDVLMNDPNLNYPSTHWVPSLFRHPASELFECPPIDRLRFLKQWKPDRLETVAIVSLAVLSILNPVQDWLMDTRQGMQSLYRMTTGQIPTDAPLIQLVTIDQASLDQAGITKRQPLDWAYLATILDRLSDYQPAIVGFDILLDNPNNSHSQAEIKALQRSLQRFKQTPFVFASLIENDIETQVIDQLIKPPLPLSKLGYTNMADWYLPLMRSRNCEISCPFAMRLANPGRPMVLSTQPITKFFRPFRQFWLHPIQDLSIPPDRIYQRISAKELGKLDRSQLQGKTVLIAAGDYKEAGIDNQTPDYSSNIPLAIRLGTAKLPKVFTGGEHLAYATHHLMQRHFIIPIPDLWGVLMAGAIGKFWQIRSTGKSTKRRFRFILGIVIYGLIGLQLYLSAKLLLPFLLPMITLGLVTRSRRIR